jgi:NAD(P)H dehydrogenase (quinone)
MTYAVTGSTGAFGTLAVQHLLNLKVPASNIVALARNEGKTAGLKKLGVQVRIADYTDVPALTAALKGVDRLLLVSGNEFGQRAAQHKNVFTAAKAAGVKLVAYTSAPQVETSTNPVAPEHKETEAALKASGLTSVVLRNNWYHENYHADAKYAGQSGLLTAALSHGKVASASRSDYAEAAAKVLVGEGHAGKTYELAGAAWDYPTLAKTIGEVAGKPVKFQTVTFAERQAALQAAGLPEGFAGFYAAVDVSIDQGSLALATGDLEKLLGRKPQSLKDNLKAAF